MLPRITALLSALLILGCDEPPTDCDLIDGSGCSGGERCGVFLNAEGEMLVGCVPSGSSGPGERCSYVQSGVVGHDTCSAGYACVDERCERLCTDSDHTTCEGAYPEGGEVLCMPVPASWSVVWPGVMVCRQPERCDPYCQDCSDPDQMCLISTDGALVCHDRFRPSELAGDGGAGDPCSGSNTCLPGFVCLADDLCYPFCDPTGEADPDCPFAACDSGSTCMALSNAPAGACSL